MRLTLSGRARHVSFGDETLMVDLEDGRQIAVPIAWFPRLVAADAAQRSRWELVGRGIGISWPDIDEDISVENLLNANGEILLARSAAPDVDTQAPGVSHARRYQEIVGETPNVESHT
jgi:hypothetical protein